MKVVGYLSYTHLKLTRYNVRVLKVPWSTLEKICKLQLAKDERLMFHQMIF